jgi:predicted enzyme related to lactoylglutathione lyase
VGQRSEYKPGTFCWADLATTDPDAAKEFYGDLFGWEAEDVPTGDDGGVYTMLKKGDDQVGALFAQGPSEREQGIPPHWNNYVTVEDVDAVLEKAGELGGEALGDAIDVMEAGRMGVIQDPNGGIVCVWQPKETIGATRVNEPGCLCWNDLTTKDPDAAEKFYTELFGWRTEKLDTDEVDYRVIFNGDRSNGGIVKPPDDMGDIPPFWTPYFAVESVDDTLEKAKEAGAEVMAGPLDVPQGRFVVLRDPGHAVFAVYEGNFDE